MVEIDPKIEEFLAKRARNAYVTTLREDGSASTVPVWYDWDGTTLRLFTPPNSPKIKRLQNDPRITVVIGNEVDEYENWISFEGKATLNEKGGKALALKCTSRYWDLSDPKRQKMKAEWEASSENYFLLIELVPERIQSI